MLVLNKLPNSGSATLKTNSRMQTHDWETLSIVPRGPRAAGKCLSLSIRSEKLARRKIPACRAAPNAHPLLTAWLAGAHNTTNFPRTKVNLLVFAATEEETHFKPLLGWGVLLKTTKNMQVLTPASKHH